MSTGISQPAAMQVLLCDALMQCRTASRTVSASPLSITLTGSILPLMAVRVPENSLTAFSKSTIQSMSMISGLTRSRIFGRSAVEFPQICSLTLAPRLLEQITQSWRAKQRRIFVSGKERERRRSSATPSEQRHSQRQKDKSATAP